MVSSDSCFPVARLIIQRKNLIFQVFFHKNEIKKATSEYEKLCCWPDVNENIPLVFARGLCKLSPLGVDLAKEGYI